MHGGGFQQRDGRLFSRQFFKPSAMEKIAI
jgi:hypothetical protein